MPTALERGRAALAAADWAAARDAFAEAVREQGGAEAHDGLGYAVWWLGDVAGALEHREDRSNPYAAPRHGGPEMRFRHPL